MLGTWGLPRSLVVELSRHAKLSYARGFTPGGSELVHTPGRQGAERANRRNDHDGIEERSHMALRARLS